jgi:hypothetical protein
MALILNEKIEVLATHFTQGVKPRSIIQSQEQQQMPRQSRSVQEIIIGLAQSAYPDLAPQDAVRAWVQKRKENKRAAALAAASAGGPAC